MPEAGSQKADSESGRRSVMTPSRTAVRFAPPLSAFIWEKGWEAFEDALVRQDPDLVDPARPQLDL
ncbi:hypothetical protein GCM10010326_77640 [Streptomyces xanthochromogenes]|uniref:Uncharacterized protein n=1 Tax=Streptomyces xanthochromogenes TaxID=67384 RepID=A0ABQ3B0V6_9ACTN|nr:hypothetical protein GCM10010326_77640 [Streptomyces xanthochromogenes]